MNYGINIKMYTSIMTFLFFVCYTTGQHITSWCDKSLCGTGQVHVACNNTGDFHARCSGDAVMIDLLSYRTQILHEHNKRRNFIAAGKLEGYYPAAKMATMVWDNELEFLATMNLKTCQLEHDDCNHSVRFKNVGQNLSGVYRFRTEVQDIIDLIQQSLSLWFGEFPLIDNSYISRFRVTRKLEKYGHFVESVVDRNTHVGCAMMRFTNPRFPYLHIYNTACNYASVYAYDTPVYRSGYPASQCKTGPNPYYPALCSINEVFNPNYHK